MGAKPTSGGGGGGSGPLSRDGTVTTIARAAAAPAASFATFAHLTRLPRMLIRSPRRRVSPPPPAPAKVVRRCGTGL
jgi:hypothetical protein